MPTQAPRKTLAGLFGTDAANALARIGLDLLTCTSQDRARLVREGRAAADKCGVPWQALKADNARRKRARA